MKGLPQPYLLLVLPSSTDAVVIRDPQDGGRIVHEAADYASAKLWLLEDEYARVEGRMRT